MKFDELHSLLAGIQTGHNLYSRGIIEGEEFEFKAGAFVMKYLPKLIAGFANRKSGDWSHILVGVEDTGRVVGITQQLKESLDQSYRSIYSSARVVSRGGKVFDLCKINSILIDGGYFIWVVSVPVVDGVWYGLHRGSYFVYVRHGSCTSIDRYSSKLSLNDMPIHIARAARALPAHITSEVLAEVERSEQNLRNKVLDFKLDNQRYKVMYAIWTTRNQIMQAQLEMLESFKLVK